MAQVRVPISDEVLDWAISRTGLTTAELAALNDFKQIDAWVDGNREPTFAQAQKLAKKAGIPFGFLLLPDPTDLTPDLPDFRTEKNSQLARISKELEEQIFLCQRSLTWYGENAPSYGAKRPEGLGSARTGDAPESIANKQRPRLGWVPDTPLHGQTHVNLLAECLENYGILVMKGAVVGNKTHSSLDREEFRGFTLIDDGYALIFLNTNDSPTANLFSLAHELGHVLLGKQGVSSTEEHNKVERWCNKFAASFLLPADSLADAKTYNPIDLEYLKGKSQKLGPSVEAIIWRLVSLGTLTQDCAQELVNSWNSQDISRNKDKKSAGGPRPEVLARARLGRNFLGVLSEAYVDGNISYRDAAGFTGYKKLDTLEKVLSLRPGEE